jgi:hypothetical protein
MIIRNYQNDKEAHCLANTYAFNPPRKTNPAYKREQYSGKYEPSPIVTAASRFMLLAGFHDKTNLLIKYTPAELIFEPP